MPAVSGGRCRTWKCTFAFSRHVRPIMLLIGAIVGGMVTFAGVALKEHFYPSSSAAACSPPKP
jgi:hypothetical protein